ncbi:MAG TPA: tRNA (adenosine(37)-N6)-threonylcarbamoyltransferase complex ATPase subunit type 1 TsaE [Actinomycetes bacterium]|nr:tRNA (adenosine(37)-N6)-threonylcarbamoyltransferase complex ATPase subunit type 1 TsaE [Actinomycetes bacterium]
MSAAPPSGLVVRDACPSDAQVIRDVVVEAFLDRPRLDPPTTATDETVHSVREALESYGGVVAELEGQVVGALLLAREADVLTLRRVATRPGYRRRGVAGAMAAHAEARAQRIGVRVVALSARPELPATVGFWRNRGFTQTGRRGHLLDLAKPAPVSIVLPDAAATRRLGARIAGLLHAGDLVVLAGELGAGKTTLAQGLGAALGVRGEVTSPTYVIARVHPSTSGGPDLVHVDAYRLGGQLEVDDLDLDASVEESVTVVEWGEGKVEALAEDRLEVRIDRDAPGGRLAVVRGIGRRWLDAVDGLTELASIAWPTC